MIDRYIGYVEDLFVYPFTGMRGMPQESISAKSSSIVGDRMHTLVAVEGPRTNKIPNTIHSTHFPELMLYDPYFKTFDDPTSPVIVVSPEGKEFPATSKELLDELSARFGHKLARVDMGRQGGFSAEISFISNNGSIANITKRVELEYVASARFRPNVVTNIAAPSDVPVNQEAGLLGTIMLIANEENPPLLAVTRETSRCKTIVYDPTDLEVTGQIMTAIPNDPIRPDKKYLGAYAKILREGKIKVGDQIQRYVIIPS